MTRVRFPAPLRKSQMRQNASPHPGTPIGWDERQRHRNRLGAVGPARLSTQCSNRDHRRVPASTRWRARAIPKVVLWPPRYTHTPVHAHTNYGGADSSSGIRAHEHSKGRVISVLAASWCLFRLQQLLLQQIALSCSSNFPPFRWDQQNDKDTKRATVPLTGDRTYIA